MKRKLYALHINIWDMDSYIAFRDEQKCCDPKLSVDLLFPSEESAREYAKTVDCDDETYNEAFLSGGEVDNDTVLNITGFDDMEDFDLALADSYLSDATAKTFGYAEKAKLSYYIQNELRETDPCEEPVECANYNIDKSIEGAVIIIWNWDKYVGYARHCREIRIAFGETEAFLAKKDKVFVPLADMVMTKEEVENSCDVEAVLRERLLQDASWKWNNPGFVEDCILNI